MQEPARKTAFMDTAEMLALPFVDVHTKVVAADADAVWRVLGEVLDRSFGDGLSVAYARLVGCADPAPAGPRPLTEGSTITGFRVAATDPGRKLALVGRHHFSTYALLFHLEDAGPGHTLLRAETRARFPGPLGALYGRLVIGTGGHAIGVRHILRRVGERAPSGARGTARPATTKPRTNDGTTRHDHTRPS